MNGKNKAWIPWLSFGLAHFTADALAWASGLFGVFRHFPHGPPSDGICIRYVPTQWEFFLLRIEPIVGFPVMTSGLEPLWNGTGIFHALFRGSPWDGLLVVVLFLILNSIVWVVAARMLFFLSVMVINQTRHGPT